MAPFRLTIDGATFRDPHNREITLRGINISGDTKFPAHPSVPAQEPAHFFEGDTVSFVDRPFPLSDAHPHFSRLKRWGYNTIRYIFTWEAVEHEGPGKYDEEFIKHTVEILRIAKEYGFYVFMDPHQDVWSRFTGGSGAPMWTLHACGFDPEKFHITQAAIVQNTWPNPAEFPRMCWATNYNRLACQTMMTLFFAGRDFAPKCVIDGKNIQDWLQEHFIAACKHIALRIHEAGDLEQDVVIGHETMNEPNRGFVGYPDLTTIPEFVKLRKVTTPTAWQAMLTGSGRAVEVETWDFGSLGPYKSGTQLVDPKGEGAWLDPTTWDDSKYGWKRGESWKLGECIWAQHGVWSPSSDELLLPQYFLKHPGTGETLDEEYWTNNYFMDYYRAHKAAIRSVWPESIIFMQPSPFEIPPRIKGTEEGEDKNIVFASHFYDGITLITKKWNRIWNVDVIGVMRGKYLTPAFAIKVGETAIRNCFRDQLSFLRQEGDELMGLHPCVFTEIGIPYDMDEKKAYQTGDYSSQIAAVDANSYAVEGSGVQGFTWWVYTATNSHFWGDNWNTEDLSIYCKEDRPLPPASYSAAEATPTTSKLSLDPSSASYSESQSESNAPIKPGSLQKTLSVNSMTAQQPTTPSLADGEGAPGFRAAEAYVRPSPVFTHGTVSSYGFDLKTCTFTLSLTSPSPTPQDHPTEVFLPDFHFPQQHQQTTVETSGGKWTIQIDEEVEGAPQQVFRWWHGEGEQKCTVRGVKRKNGAMEGRQQEEGYMEAYWAMGRNCAVM